MTKQQLALCAGISVRTLSKWCRPYKKELEALGMTSHMKLLPPHIVGWICNRFCIDADWPCEKNGNNATRWCTNVQKTENALRECRTFANVNRKPGILLHQTSFTSSNTTSTPCSNSSKKSVTSSAKCWNGLGASSPSPSPPSSSRAASAESTHAQKIFFL